MSTGQEIDSGKAKLLKKISEIESTGRKSPTRSIKRIVPAIAIAAVLMAANCISVLAWDMNIVSAVIKFTKGGFSVDFDVDEPVPVEMPTSEDDPYGFIAKLAEYDIEFETPHYIPEGFVLTEVETGNNDVGQIVRFFFENGKMVICLTYSKYYNEIPQVVIPSDYYNISETEVNGTPAIVSKEDNQYTIMYQKNKTEFFMFSNKVPYDECEKIIDSIQ